MAREAMESDGRVEARPQDEQSDLKWVVGWLVKERGQRRAAKVLGVNRKTVALALRRERLTGRMNHAVQTFLAKSRDPERRHALPLDRMEAQITLMESQIASLGKSMDELYDLFDALTPRVETLEEVWTRAQAENGDEANAEDGDVVGSDEREDEPEVEPEPEQAGRRFGRWWRR